MSLHDDFKVIGEADSGAKGLELFRQYKPDLVILSLRLPDSCAVDGIEQYLAIQPKTKIIVLADSAGDVEITKSLKKGALGYILKNVSEEELIKAIRTVSSGHKYIPGNIAAILSENLGQEDLTTSEKNVLEMVVAGKANKQIAMELNISENTVKSHVKNVFDKLGVSDRTSATTLAIKRGFVRIDN